MVTTIKKLISKHLVFPDVEILKTNDLSDAVVVITGGSRGIGKAIAEVVSAQGAKIALISPNKEELHKAFQDYPVQNCFLFVGDISKENDVKRFIQQTVDRFGKIDVLINNAGLNVEKPINQVTYDEFTTLFNVNLVGTFLCCREVISYMKKSKQGLIINIGSKISHNTNIGPYKVVYATTKYAIEGFSRALANELKKYAIRVTCLMPGTVNTFVSLNARKFLSPYHIAELIVMIIKLKEIDVEGLVFKSRHQDI